MINKTKRNKQVPKEIVEGRVIKNTGNSYIVKNFNGQEFNCKVKGNFRIKGIRTTNPVAVGDIVKFNKSADDVNFIEEILPRKNYIIRRASNLSKESHILAANIDQAVIVATLYDPITPTTFIDRFLATSEAYSIPAIVVFNKMDLWNDEGSDFASSLKELYENAGYRVLFISTITDQGLDEFKQLTSGKITLLAGNSGVGKSSLINALVPGIMLKTGDISDVHHTGTHTTTFSEMISLPYGGEIIDIPGIKGFGTIEFKETEVGHFFPEIFRISTECKYGNCRHINEPGCAVIDAVDKGVVAPSRYVSYLSIMEEVMDDYGNDKYRKPF